MPSLRTEKQSSKRFKGMPCQRQSVLSRIALFRFLIASTALTFALNVYAGVELQAPADNSRAYNVDVDVQVTGKLQTPIEKKKFATHNLNVKAAFQYSERHLLGLGPNAASLRSIRMIGDAGAAIEIGNEKSSLRLREGRRLFIAHGNEQGMTYYSPSGPLTFTELDLLTHPGDSLAVWALLPNKNVEIGESWDCDNWVAQVLADIDAVFKNELACKLESVTSGIANISFSGVIEGASDGAGVEAKVTGSFEFDLEQQLIRVFRLEQSEKRDPGTVSAGMDVVANVVVKQSVKPTTPELSDEIVKAHSAKPTPVDTFLQFQAPWQIGFLYGREWHVFQSNSQFAVMRLLDDGQLIAQCNLTKLPAVAAGSHTDEKKFESDIYEALGDQIEEIVEAQELKTETGGFRYRVVAEGKVGDLPMMWIYYLCTSSDGRQTALVFVLEPKNFEKLAERDRQMVETMTFHADPVKIRPASAQP